MKSNQKGRILALQTLYALDFNDALIKGCNQEKIAALNEEEEKRMDKITLNYAFFLINGVIENLDQIDEIIIKYSSNRTLKDIQLIDRNILRISVFSFLYIDLHPSIIISEGVKLSQNFSNAVNYKFVNGILDAIGKSDDIHKN